MKMQFLILNEYSLPEGWHLASLADLVVNPKSEIVDGPFGSNLKASEYLDQGVPIIRIHYRTHFRPPVNFGFFLSERPTCWFFRDIRAQICQCMLPKLH